MADHSRDYPKMLYHADGRTQVVHSREEERGLDGFESTPSEVHLNPPQMGASRVVPASSGNDDLIAKFRSLLEEFFGADDDKPKRGAGRPRKDSDNG